MGVGVIDGVLNRGDFFGVLIRYFNAKLIFEGHNQFHGVERVGTKIGYEGLLRADL